MTPVVDGLRDEYSGRAAIVILNAGFGEGKEAFEAYKLPGHPSYVLLNSSGEEVWRAFGPQPKSILETAIDEAVSESNSN